MDVHTYHTYVSDVLSFLFASYVQIHGWLWLKKNMPETVSYEEYFSTNIWAVWVQKNCRKYSSKILFGKYGKRLTVQKHFFLVLMAGCEGVSMRCHRGSR